MGGSGIYVERKKTGGNKIGKTNRGEFWKRMLKLSRNREKEEVKKQRRNKVNKGH